MKKIFIYILNFLFLFIFIGSVSTYAFDKDTYIEQTTKQLQELIANNKKLIDAGKANEVICIKNIFKETYGVDIVGDNAVSIHQNIQQFGGKVLLVIQAPIGIGPEGYAADLVLVKDANKSVVASLTAGGEQMTFIIANTYLKANAIMNTQASVNATEGPDVKINKFNTDIIKALQEAPKSFEGILGALGTSSVSGLESLKDLEHYSDLSTSNAFDEGGTSISLLMMDHFFLLPSCQFATLEGEGIEININEHNQLSSLIYKGDVYSYVYHPYKKIGLNGEITYEGSSPNGSGKFLPFEKMDREIDRLNQLAGEENLINGFKYLISGGEKIYYGFTDTRWIFKNLILTECVEGGELHLNNGSIIIDDCALIKNMCLGEKGGTGQSTSGATTRIINKTKDPNIDLSTLLELFNGQKSITSTTDPTKKYRTSKVILFLTDDSTTQIDFDAFHDLPTPNGEIKLWLKKSVEGKWTVQKGIDDNIINSIYATQLGYAGTFSLNSFLKGETYTVQDLATVTYLLADWMSKGVGHLYIPEYWWNCDLKDKFNPPLFVEVIKHVLEPTAVIADYFMNKNKIDPVFNSAAALFAGKCGVWDGFVGLADALPQAAKLLTMNFSEDSTAKKESEMMSRLIDENGGGVSGFAGMMWKGISSTFDPSKPCVFSHASGEVVFDVIAGIFTGGTAAAGSKVGSAIRIALTTLENLDVVGLAIGKATGAVMKVALNGTTKVLTFSVKSGTKFIEATLAQSTYLIKVFDATTKVLKDLDWNDLALVRQVTLVTLDGKQSKMLVFQDPSKAIKDGIYKIEEILKDDAGVPIRNANGDYTASVEITDPLHPNAKPKQDIVIVKSVDEVMSVFSKYPLLMDKLNGLTPANKQKFLTYFAGASTDVVDKIGNNPNLVDAWKRLDDAEVDLKFRKNPDILKNVNDLYNPLKFQLPSNRPVVNGTKVDFDFTVKTRDGLNDVYFDKNGFPDFDEYSLGNNFSYKPDGKVLNGSTSDLTNATVWRQC